MWIHVYEKHSLCFPVCLCWNKNGPVRWLIKNDRGVCMNNEWFSCFGRLSDSLRQNVKILPPCDKSWIRLDNRMLIPFTITDDYAKATIALENFNGSIYYFIDLSSCAVKLHRTLHIAVFKWLAQIQVFEFKQFKLLYSIIVGLNLELKYK